MQRIVSVLSLGVLISLCFLFTVPRARAQASNLVEVDASATFVSPVPISYRARGATSPSGQTIGINSRYLTLNGKPWLPVMGEFHYSRYPEEEWEEQILKMKADGVQIIATYIFWIHIEEVEGRFDWSGQRNLRHFVELCAKHGMYVYPRIGPWAHGEARNGGFPDWLLKKGPTRRNDPTYLRYVDRYYAQIGNQLKGLLWKDGGPVIGIQLENEYGIQGEGAGTEHILKLKEMAIEKGMDVPLYTITGWSDVPIPREEVLPVSGGYPDAPWDDSLHDLPPGEVYAFRFDSRTTGDMGAVGEKTSTDATSTAFETPFMTAEMGGGVQITYHRRPVIQPDDVAAMLPVMIGSGVNLYGTYMFQGGENPEGKLSTLQESQASGYATDVPVKSYDFQAPLGEFGTEGELFRKLKIFNYFLNDFGEYLAPMPRHVPALRPTDPTDFKMLRIAVRSENERGFIFGNNYVRGYTMPVRKATQIMVRLPGEELRIPETPVDIPSGAYFIWPFNLDLGGFKLRYSTAQLFTKIARGSNTSYFFIAIPRVRAEFAFDSAPGVEILAKGATVQKIKGTTYVRDVQPGMGAAITLRGKSGAETTIVLLSQETAEQAWKVKLDGSEHLMFTKQQFFADEKDVYLLSDGDSRFRFDVMPALDQTFTGDHPLQSSASSPGISSFAASLEQHEVIAHIEKIRNADIVPPVKTSPSLSWRKQGIALAPDASAFERAAKWRITLPDGVMNGISDLFLNVNYAGDVAQLSAKNRLLADDFYDGMPWIVGLKRFVHETGGGPFVLSILPLRKDAPIFIEDSLRPAFSVGGQIGELKSLTFIPQYRLVIDCN